MLWTAALFSLLQAAPMDSLQTPVHAAHSVPTDPDTLFLKQLDEVVITGSREFQSRRESPVRSMWSIRGHFKGFKPTMPWKACG